MKKSARTGAGKYERLQATCRKPSPVDAAVAYPCEETARRGMA